MKHLRNKRNETHQKPRKSLRNWTDELTFCTVSYKKENACKYLILILLTHVEELIEFSHLEEKNLVIVITFEVPPLSLSW